MSYLLVNFLTSNFMFYHPKSVDNYFHILIWAWKNERESRKYA